MPPRSTAHPTLRQIGRRIRAAREAKRWTQEEFAHESGTDRAYINGLEQGLRNPSALKLIQICKALGVRPNDLLLGE